MADHMPDGHMEITGNLLLWTTQGLMITGSQRLFRREKNTSIQDLIDRMVIHTYRLLTQ